MAIGGFNGTDPAPTLAQFEKYVAEGRIHYYIAVGADSGAGAVADRVVDDLGASQIASWVTTHFTARTVDGVTLYDLTTGSG